MNEQRMAIGIGDPVEMQRFVDTHPIFVEKLPFLDSVRDKVFQRQGTGTLFDIAIFAFGRVCSEDFQQGFILCGNGFGIGASQILRGMYERHVTASYLLKHPDELDRFLDYDKVHRYKGLSHFARPYAPEEFDKIISKKTQDLIRTEYETVKNDFTMTLCKKCKTTQPMFSWTKLSTLELAIRAERGLDSHYYNDYFQPTIMSHSTAASLHARIREDPNGHPYFDAEGQRSKVSVTLMSLHLLLLFVLDLQNDHFKLAIDADLKQLERDYRDCWAPNEPDPPESAPRAADEPEKD